MHPPRGHHTIRVQQTDSLPLDVHGVRRQGFAVRVHHTHDILIKSCAVKRGTRHGHLRQDGARGKIRMRRIRRIGSRGETVNIDALARRDIEIPDVHVGILADINAVRAYDIDVLAALERTADRRRGLARDDVQIVVCLCPAVELYRLTACDGKVLPADDIVPHRACNIHGIARR